MGKLFIFLELTVVDTDKNTNDKKTYRTFKILASFNYDNLHCSMGRYKDHEILN